MTTDIKLEVNFQGHHFHEEYLRSEFLRSIKLRDTLIQKNPEIYVEHFKGFFCVIETCGTCGKRVSFKRSDPQDETKEEYTADTACQYKDGFPPIEALMEVPSGEILFFNDIRREYNDEESFDICTIKGTKEFTDFYAEQGLIMHFVGNTCPSIFQVSPDKLEVGHAAYDIDDEENIPETPPSSCDPNKSIGYVCTDLWWYCAVDRSIFEKHIGKTIDQYVEEGIAKKRNTDYVLATATPGTYKTVGQYHIDSDHLFSYLERVK